MSSNKDISIQDFLEFFPIVDLPITLNDDIVPEISKLKEMKAGLDWSAPPDGWVHPMRHPHLWSATDIWWLRSKWFKIEIDTAFEVQSQGELAAYTDLMARFQENGGPTPGASQ